jgi:DNA-binding NarL/FixJ family response regulator
MANPPRMIRLLIAENNEPVRYTLRTTLKQYLNLEIVAEAADGDEAVSLAEQLQPTVVVMNINMPKVDGIAATRRIKGNWPHIAVVGLSMHGDRYLTNVMLKSGANEVISKEKATEDLYGAIKRASALCASDDAPEHPGGRSSGRPEPRNDASSLN